MTKSSPDLAGADGSPPESTRAMGASVAIVSTAHAAASKACRQRPSEEQLSPPPPTDEDFPLLQIWTPRLRDGTQVTYKRGLSM